MEVEVIYDDSPMLEREDRPRSRTWPILPPPCETIHENECDAEIAQRPPIIEESQVEEEEEEEKKTEGQNTRKNARKNAWGNLSYADLITQAIQASPESRLTLSQIYEWMVRNIPYFKDKGDSTSSAGWKNSIRHNLSLHSRFMRVQNDNNGKSSYWVINPDAKPGKSSRRRAGSVDGQPKDKSKRARNKKMYQSTDDMTSLSPVNMKFKQNRSYDNLFAVSSPCSSTDSLSNMGDGEFHPDVCSPYGAGGAEVVCSTYTGESFNRPRSTSNVSLQSNVGCDQQLDDDLMRLEQQQIICQEDNGANDLIGGRFNFGSIKLEDGLKVPEQQGFGQHDKLSVPKTGNSDSFGSSDSGYESPAYFSPPQKNPTNQMQTIGNHTGVRPPPPYTQSYGNLNYPPQNGFYAQPPPQTRPSFMMNPASPQNNVPRLKHLPYGQPSYQTTPSLSMHKQYSRHNNVANNRNLIGTPNRVYDGMCQQPQTTIQNGMPCHITQIKTESNNNIIDSMPSDLDQVKLFGFDDQQQLALDLNQIIENDLKGQSQSLQSLCEPMMNSNGPTTTSSFTYQQSWVR